MKTKLKIKQGAELNLVNFLFMLEVYVEENFTLNVLSGPAQIILSYTGSIVLFAYLHAEIIFHFQNNIFSLGSLWFNKYTWLLVQM